jgi:hypothetical protein
MSLTVIYQLKRRVSDPKKIFLNHRITCCVGCSDNLPLTVDLCGEKNKKRFVLSVDGEVGDDLIGDDEDYKIRLEINE